ncbi:beta carbonic anhydrase 1 isoform X2 [Danaus plexippus]|uniref:Carbonic anhydrase n=1 Tax=Danaus plexippus plexippus TaxID=278856 RepID=A0A212EZX3_DANPL|nr:beta carbonic anhydrase 1 isoform X2 [Danaus plexippus]OWR47032.1 putative carbonic anhydrase [Danaus plexippus plexippus]
MDRILRGIMRYRVLDRATMVKQFQQVKDNPVPKAIFYTCMDSRMIPTRFTETCVGDMFVIRNAGNLIPHSRHFVDEMTSCEPAGLELSCIVNDIKHVIVCGHSDCKAMNLLYKLKSADESNLEQRRISPLKSWLCAHGKSSLNKFLDVKGDFNKPILFSAETPQRKFVAYIDPENQFCIEDKLSQVNTLQQLQNIASYGMLKKRLEKHDLHIHALWFDIYTGDIYYFSRRAKRFLIIDEASYEVILAEIRRYYS